MTQELAHEGRHSEPPHRAFLVRCWYRGSTWHFALETIGPRRQRRGFTSAEALFAYVQAYLDDAGGTPAPR